MSWEISHAPEAWACYQRGLEAQSIEWLREAVATCRADHVMALEQQFMDACWYCDIDDEELALRNWQTEYDKALEEVQDTPGDVLVDECIRNTERHMICSNGGFHFYVDEDGYFSICLSDYEEEEEEA